MLKFKGYPCRDVTGVGIEVSEVWTVASNCTYNWHCDLVGHKSSACGVGQTRGQQIWGSTPGRFAVRTGKLFHPHYTACNEILSPV